MGMLEAKAVAVLTYARRLWKRLATASKQGLGSLGMAGRTRKKSMWLMQSPEISISISIGKSSSANIGCRSKNSEEMCCLVLPQVAWVSVAEV